MQRLGVYLHTSSMGARPVTAPSAAELQAAAQSLDAASETGRAEFLKSLGNDEGRIAARMRAMLASLLPTMRTCPSSAASSSFLRGGADKASRRRSAGSGSSSHMLPPPNGDSNGGIHLDGSPSRPEDGWASSEEDESDFYDEEEEDEYAESEDKGEGGRRNANGTAAWGIGGNPGVAAMPGVRREGRGHVGYSTSSATDAWLCSLRLQATAHLNVGLLLGQGSAKQRFSYPLLTLEAKVRCAEISITEEQGAALINSLATIATTRQRLTYQLLRPAEDATAAAKARREAKERAAKERAAKASAASAASAGGEAGGEAGGGGGGGSMEHAAEGGDPRDAALARGHPRAARLGADR